MTRPPAENRNETKNGHVLCAPSPPAARWLTAVVPWTPKARPCGPSRRTCPPPRRWVFGGWRPAPRRRGPSLPGVGPSLPRSKMTNCCCEVRAFRNDANMTCKTKRRVYSSFSLKRHNTDLACVDTSQKDTEVTSFRGYPLSPDQMLVTSNYCCESCTH